MFSKKPLRPSQNSCLYNESPVQVRWRKRTMNFISSFFASGHCASNRPLCFISSQQLCRNSKCSYEIPACLYEKPQPLTSKGPDPAQPCGADHSSRNVGCASSILAEGMSKLSVDMPCQRKQDAKMEMLNPFMFNLESSKHHGASSSKTKPSEQNGPGDNRAQYTVKMSMTDGGLLNLSGAGMMSDVALHSHICEFCQAVFPGDSTTRGEFLRHLYTHVT